MLTSAAVHTTGINWDSVATIVTSIVTAISLIGGFMIKRFAKYLGDRIDRAIDKLRIDPIGKLDTRLVRVEAVLEVEHRGQGDAHAREG